MRRFQTRRTKPMRNTILLSTLISLIACAPPAIGLDDEAGTTTSASESSTSESSTSDESTSSTTSTSTSTSTSTEAGFVPMNDTPGDGCDSFAQDCPPGEKCVPYSMDGGIWNASKCVPVLGDQQPGEACVWDGFIEATDDCDASSICWNAVEVDGQLIGECAAICTGSPDLPMCPPASSCLLSDDGVIFVCITDCDPLLQDCAEGLGCYWANNEFACIFEAPPGIATGEPCGFINDCMPGNLCADATSLPSCAGASCCTGFCDVTGGDTGCAAQPGTVCTAFFELGTAPPGYDDVGVCTIPP